MNEITLSPLQLEAVERCCHIATDNRIVSVSGQAGTGKTTIIRQVYQALEAAGYSVVLCAPTGKAAKRITEATGIEARTIHRLLEYSHPGQPDPETGVVEHLSLPKRTRDKPLIQDVIIVDESAMINTGLYRNLIDAMKPGSCIRFFGDVNQLPPIEENGFEGPSPFSELVRSNHHKSVHLTDIFRQGAGSGIVRNGQLILKGMVPNSLPDFGVRIVPVPIKTLGDMCRQLILEGDPLFNKLEHQIITPAKQGKVGSIALNKILCDIYHLGTESAIIPRKIWEAKKSGIYDITVFVGQKVIINSNMYDLRQTIAERYDGDRFIPADPAQMVYNGESGLVVSVEGGFIAIDVGDRIVTIPPWQEVQKLDGTIVEIDPRTEIDHAYAITTHKAQGSEYQSVLYFISSSCYINQCRPNFYTGVTRARKIVSVVSDEKSIKFWSLRKESGAYQSRRR